MENLPNRIESEAQLDELLSRPTEEVMDLFRRLQGDLVILGGGGKIGPSLAGMAARARAAAGGPQEITVIDRFPDAAGRLAVEAAGACAVACDLLDPDAVAGLPLAENVVYMVGMKFGTSGNPAMTWAVNGLVPAYVARHYRQSRIVAFSTGCVYEFVPAASGGSVETAPLTPLGEYANSCVARERLLECVSLTHGTPMLLLRLNYALDMRYGVLVDIAAEIAAGRPVDVSMGYFNAIWQGDVNAAVLRLLEHAATPARPLNLTGTQTLSVRAVATQLAQRMGKPATFKGTESPAALLSNTSAAVRLLGEPRVPIQTVLNWTADWVAGGGRLLGKPTHFQTRDGKY